MIRYIDAFPLNIGMSSIITDLASKVSDSRDALVSAEREELQAKAAASAASDAVNAALLKYHTDRSALEAALTDPSSDEVSPPAPPAPPAPVAA